VFRMSYTLVSQVLLLFGSMLNRVGNIFS